MMPCKVVAGHQFSTDEFQRWELWPLRPQRRGNRTPEYSPPGLLARASVTLLQIPCSSVRARAASLA